MNKPIIGITCMCWLAVVVKPACWWNNDENSVCIKWKCVEMWNEKSAGETRVAWMSLCRFLCIRIRINIMNRYCLYMCRIDLGVFPLNNIWIFFGICFFGKMIIFYENDNILRHCMKFSILRKNIYSNSLIFP